MTEKTIIWILIAFLVALFIVFYQYYYKNSSKKKYHYILSLLRFITIFSLLLLIINPKIEHNSKTILKPNLVLAIDNSESIRNQDQNKIVLDLLAKIKGNDKLNSKFNLNTYSFGSSLKILDTLDFNEDKTNIFSALKEINQLNERGIAPIILISDGNQNYGTKLSYKKFNQKIFPIIIGDTTELIDLNINTLNTNKYTYLNNNFPVEVFINYSGQKPIESKLKVFHGNKIVYSNSVNLNKAIKSKQLSFSLPANKKGVQYYKAIVEPLEEEKNLINNEKHFHIDVIDEKAEILLLYDVLHPDIGLWKNVIQSSEQRSLVISHIDDFKGKLQDYQFIILFQPNSKFKFTLNQLIEKRLNYMVHSGVHTNWDFLNKAQSIVNKQTTTEIQKIDASINKDFSKFQIESLDFNSFSPLKNLFGQIKIKGDYANLLFQRINGIQTEMPLISMIQNNNNRIVYLFGEDLYAWRSLSFLNNNSFEQFDNFFNNILQYLQGSNLKSRLEVQHKPMYFENEIILVTAKPYDDNFSFNQNANMNLVLKDENNSIITIPFVLDNNIYKANLKNLDTGVYEFEVLSQNDKQKFKGSFKILNYSLEQKTKQSNFSDLKSISVNSNGKIFFPNQIDNLVTELLGDNSFVKVQKTQLINKSLINFKWLLMIIVLSLSTEWFLRKYFGLN